MKKLLFTDSISRPNSTSVARWSAAAATGLMLAGCPDTESNDATRDDTKSKPAAVTANDDGEDGSDDECCMGKNDCKGQGGCAVPESNDCAGKNDCKGKGGCNMHCPE